MRRNSVKRGTYALVMVLALSSCATQQGVIDGIPRGKPDHSEWSHFFFFGLGPDDEINAAEICGGGEKVKAVEAYWSFTNYLAGLVPGVLGIIWLPRTANVYCK